MLAVRSSAAIASSAWRAVPAAGSSTPVSASSGRWEASSASVRTRPRKLSPRASRSALRTSTSPSALACEFGQQAVDLARAAADALAGELEAEVAERGADRVVAVGGLARALRGQVAQRVVLEQHEPVVEVGRLAVGLAARARRWGPAGRPRAGSARRRGRASGCASGTRARRARRRRLGCAVRSRMRLMTHSGNSLPLVVQGGDQLAEARVVLGEPLALGRQRLGQVGELLVGREVAVADHGGRGDGEVDGPEQVGVELGLGLGQVHRRRRREADHVRVLRQLVAGSARIT